MATDSRAGPASRGRTRGARRPAESKGPQQERSRLTRERLLHAAVDVLSSEGWAAATVAAVAEAAGVSRGAAQHHFPTRESLITAALEQVFEDMTANLSVRPEDLPDGPERVDAVLSWAVALYTGTEFKAALQVWAVAASDPALRTQILPLEAKFARAAHSMTVRALAGPVDAGDRAADADQQIHRMAQVALDLARGLGLADTLSDDSRRRAQVVGAFADMVKDALYPDQ